MPITHTKVSQAANSTDPNLIQPSDWNASHIVSGSLDLTGASNVLAKALENVQIVDSTLSRGGVDIGDEINKAYAAGTGAVRIWIAPKADGSCYNFSTPIVLTTASKYPLLEYIGAAGVAGLSTPQGCLNFTPTSGAAITLDYATATGSPDSSVHGLKNLFLVNNNCFTFGGCGGTAIAVDTGTTNQGSYEAYFDNVAIEGFNTAYRNLNNTSIGVVWNNPQFFQNGLVALLASPSPIIFNFGTYAGNAKIFKTNAASSTPGIWGNFMDMFNNTTILDATASTSPGGLSCAFCHFEASTASQTPFINGVIDIVLMGGLMEVDTAGGTAAQFVTTSGNYFYARGIQFSSSATVTNILTANSPVKGMLDGEVIGSNFGTPYVNGSFSTRIDVQIRGAGANADTSIVSENTTFSNTITAANEILTAAAPTVVAAQVGLGSTTATSATAGANGAVPSQVAGYLIINVAGTAQKIPYFNN